MKISHLKSRGQVYVAKALIALAAFGGAFYMFYSFLYGRNDTTGIIPALDSVSQAEEQHFTSTAQNLDVIVGFLAIFVIILAFVYVIYREKNPTARGVR